MAEGDDTAKENTPKNESKGVRDEYEEHDGIELDIGINLNKSVELNGTVEEICVLQPGSNLESKNPSVFSIRNFSKFEVMCVNKM